jgi:23S rRNA (adenine2030-N6)-methyltransferase
MNYRHAFHAGNPVDVIKHLILQEVLASLHRKPAPFAVLDSHAGAGRYRLDPAGESAAGIGRWWPQRAQWPDWRGYFALVESQNPGGALRDYPGSPLFIRAALRADDRALFIEKQPDDLAVLRAVFDGDRQVTVAGEDAWTALQKRVPLAAGRGLVLIDPPYERPDDFEQVLGALAHGAKHWAHGLYLVWYPIKDRVPALRLQRALVETGLRRILCAELCVLPDDVALRLNGCGMILVNPPWQIDSTLASLLPRLLEVLRVEGPGRTRVEWLVPE